MSRAVPYLAARVALGFSCAALFVASWVLDFPLLRAACPPLLVAMLLLPALLAWRVAAWLKWFLTAALMLLASLWPLFGRLLPSLACLVVAGVFAVTLRPGSTPLVQRMAEAIGAPDGPAPAGCVQAYRRRWTTIWVVWMTSLAVVLAALAWRGPAVLGWVTALVLIPAAVLGLLAFEHWWRKRRFRDMQHDSFPAFLSALAGIHPEALFRWPTAH